MVVEVTRGECECRCNREWEISRVFWTLVGKEAPQPTAKVGQRNMAAFFLWATVLLAGLAVCSSTFLHIEHSPEKVRNQTGDLHSMKHLELSLFAPLSMANDHAKLPDMNYTSKNVNKNREEI